MGRTYGVKGRKCPICRKIRMNYEQTYVATLKTRKKRKTIWACPNCGFRRIT